MKNVAQFEKVSFEQFYKDFKSIFKYVKDFEIEKFYENVRLPERENNKKACYNFKIPFDLILEHGETVIVPTGIKVKIDSGWVLKIYPVKRLGFNYRVQLDETINIIDEDYYYNEKEGHILLRITNDTKEYKIVSLINGDDIASGIFSEFGITYDDIKNLRD